MAANVVPASRAKGSRLSPGCTVYGTHPERSPHPGGTMPHGKGMAVNVAVGGGVRVGVRGAALVGAGVQVSVGVGV
jgi:hypothetical protein